MKGWKSNLFWAALPMLFVLSVMGFLFAINWDYEVKFFSLDHGASDWNGVHLGPILLIIALSMALIAGLILWLVWIFRPQSFGYWFLIPLILVTVFLVLPSLSIMVLGPAAITMMEQSRSAAK